MDPFEDHDPLSNRYKVFCCPGLVQKLGNWDGSARKTFHCVKAPPMPDWKSVVPAGPVSHGKARFLTFNTFWQNHQYQMLAGLIAQIEPDIAALEEIPSWKRRDGLLDSLKRMGTPYDWAPSGGVPVNYDGHILYRTDTWRVMESNTLLVDQRARSPGILRGVHWAAMERKADKARILVFGTHPSYDRKKPTFIPRDWPAMDIVQKAVPFMQTLAGKWDAPAVFMCDCNTGDQEPSMQWLRQGNGRMTFRTAATSAIDHIYIESSPRSFGTPSNPCVVRPNRVGVRRQEWGMADHPPVFVDVVLNVAQ
uniref:Endonuclease/exonuclease/phosphatase domain-containing protein n=1 Tax=Pyrodinium bahamense TaxID=73915 RepID=A0A7S0ADL5_9DINO